MTCASNSTCSVPTSNKATGTTVPVESATSDGSSISYGSATPLSYYNAASDTGMGVMNFSSNFSVTLPANTTYAGAYSSDFTITISSNP